MQGRFVSLRLRLLGLVALVLLPWLTLVLYAQSEERTAAIAEVHRDEARLLRIVTSNQAAEIEAARQLLTALARLPQLRSGAGAACNGLLAEMLAAFPLYLNFGVAEPNGDISCSAVALRSTVNIADRTYFERAMQERRFAIGDYQIGRVTRMPSINYGYPMLGADGEVFGVVYAAQSLNWLTAALANVDFPPGAVLFVSDRNGKVLARMPDGEGVIGLTLPDEQVRVHLARQKAGGVFEADDAQGVPRLWAHAPLIAGLDLHAAIGVSRTVAFAEIDRRLMHNLAALGVVTMLALAAAWFGGKFILRQVDSLVAATRKIGAGALGVRVPVLGDRSELEVLARAFNDMSATLASRDRELRVAQEKTRAAEVELAVTHAHMEIARQIQRSLLPQAPLTLAGMRVAGRCIPAAAVGGDYYGYFPQGPDRIDAFVGDVSGHGIGAALLMAEARVTFLAERLIEPGAGRILGKLNDVLHDDLDRADHFITACCATFDARSRELSYANAGHPPALLLRAGAGSCSTLAADGMLLGVSRRVDFAEVKLKLEPGDIVVFYTDGVTEARNAAGDLFGLERLGQAIAAHRAEDPDAMIREVLAALDRFAGAAQREDDLTIVVMQFVA
jgi:serine phosphatase RsbU (regulator of sigma subunit)